MSKTQIIKSSLPQEPEFLLTIWYDDMGWIYGEVKVTNSDKIDKSKKYYAGAIFDPWYAGSDGQLILRGGDWLLTYTLDYSEYTENGEIDLSVGSDFLVEIYPPDILYPSEWQQSAVFAVFDENDNIVASTDATRTGWYNISSRPFYNIDGWTLETDENDYLKVNTEAISNNIMPNWYNVQDKPFDAVYYGNDTSLIVESNLLKYKKNDIDCWGDVDFEFQSDTLLKVTGNYHAYVPESKMTTTLGGYTYKLRLAVTFYVKQKTYPIYMAFVGFDSGSNNINFDKSLNVDTTDLTRSEITNVGLEFVYIPDYQYSQVNPEDVKLKAVYVENWGTSPFKRIISIALKDVYSSALEITSIAFCRYEVHNGNLYVRFETNKELDTTSVMSRILQGTHAYCNVTEQRQIYSNTGGYDTDFSNLNSFNIDPSGAFLLELVSNETVIASYQLSLGTKLPVDWQYIENVPLELATKSDLYSAFDM